VSEPESAPPERPAAVGPWPRRRGGRGRRLLLLLEPGRRRDGEAAWPAHASVVVAMLLQLFLPASVSPGAGWLVPSAEGGLLVLLVVATPARHLAFSRSRRVLSLLLIAFITIANAVSLGLLVDGLVGGRAAPPAGELLRAVIGIWGTNVVAFALWYWELDLGGPALRWRRVPALRPDFLFPQATLGADLAGPGWRPVYLDYLYVSFTNATAFSPTDAMPLTLRVKGLMLVEALTSLVAVVVVVGHAVNVLG
jgi:hypothetical protein